MLLEIHYEYSWATLSQRRERKTGKIKPYLLSDLYILFWVNLQKALKLFHPSQSSSKQMEKTGKTVFMYKPILPERCDTPDLLRCSNVI